MDFLSDCVFFRHWTLHVATGEQFAPKASWENVHDGPTMLNARMLAFIACVCVLVLLKTNL